MGVVHKLSDEVRDFILAEKKALPQISCRKLSDVTYEKFQVIVSKSSISSVLKSAHLNSPIGRHSLSVEEEKIINQHKVKKFKIPEHKKSEIFSPPKPKERSVSNKNSLESAPKNPVLKNPTVKIPPQISVPITTVEKLPQVMSNLTINISSKKIPPVLQNEGVLVQNAGVIFIKAIEWILNGKSILGKVLNDEGVGRFNVQWEQVADIMLLANLVEQENISAVDFTTWKWIFNSSLEEKAPDLEIWKTSLEAAENIADCGIKLAIEFSILSQGIAYYKLIDQAGAVIYVNSQSKNIFFNNVQSEKEISFYSAIT